MFKTKIIIKINKILAMLAIAASIVSILSILSTLPQAVPNTKNAFATANCPSGYNWNGTQCEKRVGFDNSQSCPNECNG
jgi:hypothetical protein